MQWATRRHAGSCEACLQCTVLQGRRSLAAVQALVQCLCLMTGAGSTWHALSNTIAKLNALLTAAVAYPSSW